MKGKQIEISLGACFCEASEEVSFDQLYRKADRAMYQSKKKQGYSASIYEEWNEKQLEQDKDRREYR